MIIKKAVLQKQGLWLILIAANILFVFLYIYKQTQFVAISYSRQRLEREQAQLLEQQADLIQQLYAKQSSKNVKKIAIEQLGLQQISVSQIHKLRPKKMSQGAGMD